MTDKKPYHHGDLRRTIIETAEQMLDESHGWQFTLREVARRAEVSHAAPYRHFPDKAALLTELSLRSFDQLGAEMTAAITPKPDNIRDEFIQFALAYIQFGTRNPARYRLMFSNEAGTLESTHLTARSMAPLEMLIELLQRGQKTGEFKPQALQGQAAACWAQVHGITMLAIEGLLLPEKVGNTPIQAALDTLLDGLARP